jgi:hypothetical protein
MYEVSICLIYSSYIDTRIMALRAGHGERTPPMRGAAHSPKSASAMARSEEREDGEDELHG